MFGLMSDIEYVSLLSTCYFHRLIEKFVKYNIKICIIVKVQVDLTNKLFSL